MREYDPKDTVRFLLFRLHEAGLINQARKNFSQGTERRFESAKEGVESVGS